MANFLEWMSTSLYSGSKCSSYCMVRCFLFSFPGESIEVKYKISGKNRFRLGYIEFFTVVIDFLHEMSNLSIVPGQPSMHLCIVNDLPPNRIQYPVKLRPVQCPVTKNQDPNTLKTPICFGS